MALYFCGLFATATQGRKVHTDLLNIILAFLEGVALILSPCILPILPFILAGSLDGGKKRPYGIIAGFVIAFALFTFFSRALVRYSGIDLAVIRDISYLLLFIFGFVMLSTFLTEKFALLTQRLMRLGETNSEKGGFFSGMMFGSLVGLIWTPCAGPILAAVIVQSVLQKTTWGSFLSVLAFGLGSAIPMFLIAIFGKALLSRLGILKAHTPLIRRALGLIVILSVIYMVYAEEKAIPIANNPIASDSGSMLLDGLASPYIAPELPAHSEWLNSSPLQLNQLRGKVVLIDFWTYSCINCIRTLPYLKKWYQEYHAKEFEIIGVHSPEFEFEKEFENVKQATQTFGLHYPVVLDNAFKIWQSYQNRYWPAHYLIDKTGKVVYQHFGEGAYEVTENNIRFLLGLSPMRNTATESKQLVYQTPEIYLGYARADRFAGPDNLKRDVSYSYRFPSELGKDQWALAGAWRDQAQYVLAEEKNASLKLNFTARKVFIVMGSATKKPIEVKILVDGQPVTLHVGRDVTKSAMTIEKNRLYEVLNFSTVQTGVIQLISMNPGLEVYTFTFGN